MSKGRQLQKQVIQSYGSCVLHIYHGDIHLHSFKKISQTVFKSICDRAVTYITEITIFNVQRAITPKVDKQKYGLCVLDLLL